MTAEFRDPDSQLKLLLRGSVDCVQTDALLEKLKRGKPLTVKAGFDPSAPDIHLGHTVLIQKMKDFQDLGHNVVFVVGDFTATIGDPSGRSKTRPALTRAEVEVNAETYKQQALRILDPERTTLEYNSRWLDKLGSQGFIRLASHYTVARMLERDDFEKRLGANLPISLHELFYPLAQAYDSVALKADVELGGTDQTFNLLVGRDIMREYDLEPQVVLTMPLLVGLDGVQKMSKSLGNYVAIDDAPADMHGKLLSISDELMWTYWRLLTDLDDTAIAALKSDVESGKSHPLQVKHDLARTICAGYHGEEAANKAESEFKRVFSERQRPTDIEERVLTAAPNVVMAVLLADTGLASSRSEARRLIAQGGVANSEIADVDLVGADVAQRANRAGTDLLRGETACEVLRDLPGGNLEERCHWTTS